MGQGSIQYKDNQLLNCRESHLSNLIPMLKEHQQTINEEWYSNLVEHWTSETETMPPGCVNIDLTKYLQTKSEIDILKRTIEIIISKLSKNDELPYTYEEAKRIYSFLTKLKP